MDRFCGAVGFGHKASKGAIFSSTKAFVHSTFSRNSGSSSKSIMIILCFRDRRLGHERLWIGSNLGFYRALEDLAVGREREGRADFQPLGQLLLGKAMVEQECLHGLHVKAL